MSLSVAVVSDLHLETRELEFDQVVDPGLEADVLCLLGDIGDPTSDAYLRFVANCSARFPTVLLLTGNNEYRNDVGRSMADTEALIRARVAPLGNVHLLSNATHVAGHVAFIGSTLWSYAPDDPLPEDLPPPPPSARRLAATASTTNATAAAAPPAPITAPAPASTQNPAGSAAPEAAPSAAGVAPQSAAQPVALEAVAEDTTDTAVTKSTGPAVHAAASAAVPQEGAGTSGQGAVEAVGAPGGALGIVRAASDSKQYAASTSPRVPGAQGAPGVTRPGASRSPFSVHNDSGFAVLQDHSTQGQRGEPVRGSEGGKKAGNEGNNRVSTTGSSSTDSDTGSCHHPAVSLRSSCSGGSTTARPAAESEWAQRSSCDGHGTHGGHPAGPHGQEQQQQQQQQQPPHAKDVRPAEDAQAPAPAAAAPAPGAPALVTAASGLTAASSITRQASALSAALAAASAEAAAELHAKSEAEAEAGQDAATPRAAAAAPAVPAAASAARLASRPPSTATSNPGRSRFAPPQGASTTTTTTGPTPDRAARPPRGLQAAAAAAATAALQTSSPGCSRTELPSLPSARHGLTSLSLPLGIPVLPAQGQGQDKHATNTADCSVGSHLPVAYPLGPSAPAGPCRVVRCRYRRLRHVVSLSSLPIDAPCPPIFGVGDSGGESSGSGSGSSGESSDGGSRRSSRSGGEEGWSSDGGAGADAGGEEGADARAGADAGAGKLEGEEEGGGGGLADGEESSNGCLALWSCSGAGSGTLSGRTVAGGSSAGPLRGAHRSSSKRDAGPAAAATATATASTPANAASTAIATAASAVTGGTVAAAEGIVSVGVPAPAPPTASATVPSSSLPPVSPAVALPTQRPTRPRASPFQPASLLPGPVPMPRAVSDASAGAPPPRAPPPAHAASAPVTGPPQPAGLPTLGTEQPPREVAPAVAAVAAASLSTKTSSGRRRHHSGSGRLATDGSKDHHSSHQGHHHQGHHHHRPPRTVKEYVAGTSLDFRRIYATGGGEPITPDTTNQLFADNVVFITRAVEAARAQGLVPVVLTHHAPSLRGTSHPRFAGHPATHSYASDLEPYLYGSGIAAWFCGHTHHNFDMQLQGGPRLASNQYGSQPAPAPGYSSSWVRHFAPASVAAAAAEKAAGAVEGVAVAEEERGKGGEPQDAMDVWGDGHADVKATVVVRGAGAQAPVLQAY